MMRVLLRHVWRLEAPPPEAQDERNLSCIGTQGVTSSPLPSPSPPPAPAPSPPLPLPCPCPCPCCCPLPFRQPPPLRPCFPCRSPRSARLRSEQRRRSTGGDPNVTLPFPPTPSNPQPLLT